MGGAARGSRRVDIAPSARGAGSGPSPAELGDQWRRRTIAYLQSEGGEVKSYEGYGVSGIVREAIGYTGVARSWGSIWRAMQAEGVVVVLDRSEKRTWHVKLGSYPEYLEPDDADLGGHVVEDEEEDLYGYMLDVEQHGYIDYEKLAYAVLGSAAEVIAKPGRRMMRYKAMIRRLQDDSLELTHRLAVVEEELRYYRAKDPARPPVDVDAEELR